MTSLIVFIGKYFIFIIGLVALGVTIISESTVRNKLVILTILSLLIAFGMASLAGFLYYDPRPFVVEHTTPLINHIADNGFPSDHTLYAMSASATIFVYKRKTGIFLAILSILGGAARVIAGVHHPIDIIGGTLIATSATFIAWIILKILSMTKIISF
jgi:undecaprenyl-diphosphatase